MHKGDIVFGQYNHKGHPIVYLYPHDEDNFFGLMLTHSGQYADNILLDPTHFKIIDDLTGKSFKFNTSGTYLVARMFFKRHEWEPFKKIGELSQEGIEFVEKITKNQTAQFWESYNKT